LPMPGLQASVGKDARNDCLPSRMAKAATHAMASGGSFDSRSQRFPSRGWRSPRGAQWALQYPGFLLP
jgi:hypothetical protein